MTRRQSLDLTRDELADRIGCAPITIAKIERDERKPSRQMAELLADVFLPANEDRERFVRWARGVPTNQGLLELPTAPVITDQSPIDPAQSQESAQNRFNNLPFSLTSLVGREDDVARVRSILWRSDVRLLTLTGPPGIGKTRLSMAAASSISDDFEHGVCWVPLAPITDPDLVAYTITQVLNLPESTRTDPLRTLRTYLRNRHMLLVVDNFEQVVSAGGLISALLSSCPMLKVIVTSRERLHIYGEHEYPLSPLALPGPGSSSPKKEMGNDEAPSASSRLAAVSSVALFVQRAQAVSPSFELTLENEDAVAAICRELDGLPLALELAAARVRFLPPQALLSRLDNRLGLLTGGARDLPPRQQTLRGAIGWSYELLTPSEKALFNMLGVFVGGCTLEAIEAVAGTQPAHLDVLDGLASLVDKSLVRQDELESQTVHAQDSPDVKESPLPEHDPRFTMLEMIREYALEQLAISDTVQEVREQHLEYYTALAERADAYYYGNEQIKWLERMELERDNFRAAMRWALDSERHVDALRVAVALWAFWYKRLYVHEGLQWLHEALDGAADASLKLRAEGNLALGALMIAQDEYAQAKPYMERALQFYTLIGDAGSVGRCVNGLALSYLQLGDPIKAVQLIEQSIAVQQAAGHKVRLALAHSNMGYALMQLRRYQEARVHAEQSLVLRRENSDLEGIGTSLLILGGIAMHEEQYDSAIVLFEEALDICRQVGDRRDAATALMGLGLCRLNQGHYEEAEPWYRQSLSMYRDLGNEFGIARVLVGLAGILSARREDARAVRLCGATLHYYEPLLTRVLPAELDLYNKVLADARARLGDAVVNTLMYEGGLLGREEARP